MSGSIDVSFVDQGAFTEAMANLRSDTSDIKYLVATHPGLNPNVLDILATGSGDADEMLTHFDSSQVMYGMLRVTEKVEISTTTKFIFIKQVGEKVGFVKKGRFGIVTSAVKEIMGQYHLEVAIDNAAGTSQADLETKIGELSNQKSSVIESTEGRVMRGFTSKPQTSPHLDKKPSAHNYTGGLASTSSVPKSIGLATTADESLAQALKQVRSDKDSLNWVAGVYTDGNLKSNLTLLASGDGGVEEIVPHLTDDQIVYSLLRVTDIVDGHTTVKFVFISFIGEKVGMIKKAKLATHKGAVQEVYAQFHVDFYVSTTNEISKSAIDAKVSAASGSANHVIVN